MSAARPPDPISRLGAFVVGYVEETGRYFRFVGRALRGGFSRPFRPRLLFKQMHFVGVQSLSIVLITGIFTGMVFAVQANIGFSQFGAEGMIGGIVALALARELSPVLTSLMVNGRVGSAMAAELGTMRVTEQIDALESMAVDPDQYLVTPRILAATLMVPALTMVFNTIGLLGTWIVAVKQLGVNPGSFWSRIEWYVDPDDVLGGMLKGAVFGFILSSVGCYKGFTTSGGAEGVGRATTTSVVVSGVVILTVDYFMTRILAPLSVG
jgi:phospholipid/cholesterol/gamma-HCH transport system permease protein